MMKIAIANDHAGYSLKVKILNTLNEYQFIDLGADTDQSVDYPDFGHALANEVERGNVNFGIAICGSGNGINMTVNKHKNIRGALCWNVEIARLARLHNDANIVSLPARFLSDNDAIEIVRVFLNTDFEGGRHINRVRKIPCQV